MLKRRACEWEFVQGSPRAWHRGRCLNRNKRVWSRPRGHRRRWRCPHGSPAGDRRDAEHADRYHSPCGTTGGHVAASATSPASAPKAAATLAAPAKGSAAHPAGVPATGGAAAVAAPTSSAARPAAAALGARRQPTATEISQAIKGRAPARSFLHADGKTGSSRRRPGLLRLGSRHDVLPGEIEGECHARSFQLAPSLDGSHPGGAHGRCPLLPRLCIQGCVTSSI